MVTTNTYDLTFVAPHRREEVLRRIGIIERYLEEPTRAVAERSAKEMGVNVVHIYNLARIWRETGRPEALPGAGRPSKRRRQVAPRVDRLIARAVRDAPDGKVEPIVARVLVLGDRENIELPGISTIRKYVAEAMKGRLPAESFAANSDWLIDSCAVDLPVAMPGGQIVMPIATMVIDVASATVLSVVLDIAGPPAGSAGRALLKLIGGERGDSLGRKPRIAIEGYPDEDWPTFFNLLTEAGFDVQYRDRKSTAPAEAAPRLLGSWKAGVRLRPRATRRKFELRPATLVEGRPPLGIDVAEQLIQGRWEEKWVGAPSFLPAGWDDEAERRLVEIAST